jgi:tetratricopeptide (TPR) repeat protein
VAYRQARYPGARRLLAQDAVPRYDLRRTLMARLAAENPALSILLLFGDVEMEHLDLDPRTGPEAAASSFARSEPDVHGLIIAGDLLVNGAIHHTSAPVGLSLYVLGGLRAANIAISGLELVVRGSVAVDEVICGSGSAGGARLDEGVSARLLISDGFPMLIGGRLAAPVLDTGRTRIGVVEGNGVRAAAGEVPPAVVLADAARDPDAEGGRFSFARMRNMIASGRPVLSSDYLSGRTDLEAMREVRRLEREIDAALREGRYARGAELLRKARAKGASRADTGLKLADAIYRVHHGTGGREALTEALDLLNEALGPNPDPDVVMANPHALLQRASILLQLHEFDDDAFDQAWRDCSLAAVTMPTGRRAEIARLMGQALFGRHRYEEAVPYLRQALAADPNDGVLNGRIARALWLLDREEEALSFAGRSLELNPVDDRMWFVRGKCHQVLGHINEARLDLQTYLELHPDDELAVEALVEIGLDQGHVELAVERALRFIEAHPEIDGAPARFGRLLYLRGLHEQAVPLLRRAMEHDRSARQAVVDLAVAIDDLGGEHPGLVTALRSLEVDPDGDHLAYLRAECYLALAEPDRAEPDLEDYVRRFPDAARALASLAGIWLDQRRIMDAESLLSIARGAAPDDEYVRAIAQRAGFAPTERIRPGRRPSHVSRPI